MDRLRVIGAVAATATMAVLAVASASASGRAADVILSGGVVLTMDPRSPHAQAVAIQDDRIIAVGSAAHVLRTRSKDTRIVHLRGRTVLPGFNDAHAHWIGDRDYLELGSAEDAIQAVLERGFTSISELFVSEERLAELRDLDLHGELKVRVNAYLPVNFHDDKYGLWFDGAYEPRQEYSDHLRIAGAKAFVDSAGPIRMFLTEPHSDSGSHPDKPDPWYGHSSWTQEELTDVIGELHRKGWQVAIHTSGDGAHDLVLNAFDEALGGAPNRLRHRIEHMMVVRDDQIRRIRKLGLIASVQFAFFQSDWHSSPFWSGLEPALGPDRIGWAGRYRDLLDAGVRMVGSTDTPWFNQEFEMASALEAVEMAVTKVGRTGATPSSWLLAQRITVQEALQAMTRDAAYATLDEKRKGTLAPGKLADLVVLGANPLRTDPSRIGEIPVLATVIGGETAYCAPAADALCP